MPKELPSRAVDRGGMVLSSPGGCGRDPLALLPRETKPPSGGIQAAAGHWLHEEWALRVWAMLAGHTSMAALRGGAER